MFGSMILTISNEVSRTLKLETLFIGCISSARLHITLKNRLGVGGQMIKERSFARFRIRLIKEPVVHPNSAARAVWASSQ